jgi:hypothetical protein
MLIAKPGNLLERNFQICKLLLLLVDHVHTSRRSSCAGDGRLNWPAGYLYHPRACLSEVPLPCFASYQRWGLTQNLLHAVNTHNAPRKPHQVQGVRLSSRGKIHDLLDLKRMLPPDHLQEHLIVTPAMELSTMLQEISST